jgi:hypothetical protein
MRLGEEGNGHWGLLAAVHTVMRILHTVIVH